MVLSREQWLALQHLSKDASCTPDVNLNIVFLPCEHDFRSPIVSCRDVAGHLRVLYTCQAEIADFEIAILVDEDVAGLEIAMHDACGVDIFQSALSKSAQSSSLSIALPHTRI